MHGGRMGRGAVALWLVPRRGEHRDPSMEFAALDGAARERLHRLRTPEARDAHLLSRSWLSRVLRDHFGTASGSWRVGVDCSGRATLRDAPPDVAIAFSHGRDAIAIAIGHDCGAGLGIDIEDRLAADDPLLAATMLSRRERGEYHRLATSARRRHYLLRHWVAKEAYGKALGRGLALRFDTIDLRPSAPDRFEVRDPDGPDTAPWHIRLLEPDHDTALAIALAPSGASIVDLQIFDVAGRKSSAWRPQSITG